MIHAGLHGQVTKNDADRGAEPHPGAFWLQASPIPIFFASASGLVQRYHHVTQMRSLELGWLRHC